MGITNWLMEHGLVSIEHVHSPSGELTDAYARVNKEEVLKSGKEVMGKLLLEIQVRKSIGDGPGATGECHLRGLRESGTDVGEQRSTRS